MRMSGTLSVAANSTSANVLAGLQHEFLARPAAVRLAGTSSATGINATFTIGGRVVVDDMYISLANRFPILPDDIITDGAGGLPGERMVLRFRNTTAGALTVIWAVDVTYIA